MKTQLILYVKNMNEFCTHSQPFTRSGFEFCHEISLCYTCKIWVLRQKRNLSGIQGYGSVFLRSRKSHTERLLLNEIPNGRNFRVTANGRIVKKSDDQRRMTE